MEFAKLMRPYAVEVIFSFAAGMCVGAFLMDRSKAREVLETQNGGEEKVQQTRGVMVSMENGKIVIDPSKRKRWFGGKR